VIHCNKLSNISHCIVTEILCVICLDKHIPIVNALDTYFGEFWGEIGGYAIFQQCTPRGCWWGGVRY